MPIQRDTVTVGLATGVNQKTDERILDSAQTSSAKDYVFDKEGQIRVRYGQTARSTAVVTSFANPLTIGASDTPTASFAHEDQLCMINKGSLYSQYSGQDEWFFKGNVNPITVSATPVKNGASFTDSVTVQGVTALLSSADSLLYVREDLTGNILSTTTLSNSVRLVGFSNALWVLSLTGSNTIQKQQINLTTGALGSATALVTDNVGVVAGVTITSAASPVGEMAFVAYKSTGNCKVVPFDATGTVPALGVLDTGATVVGALCIYCEPGVASNKFFISGILGLQIRLGVWTFTSSAYTTVSAFATIFNSSTQFGSVQSAYQFFARTTMAINPTNNTELYVFADTDFKDPISLDATTTWDCSLYYAVTDLSGSVSTASTLYGRGYKLVAYAMRDSNRNTIYLPCVVVSPFQANYILCDVLRGNAGKTTYLQARWGQSKAAATSTGLSQVYQISSGIYQFTNNGNVVKIDLSTNFAAQSQYIAKTTHITGGLLWAYDGQSIVEHNFAFYPEKVLVTVGQTYFGPLVVNTVGDGSHKEKFTFTVYGGSFYPSTLDLATYAYINFNSLSTAYYIWFTVDGGGLDPAPGGRTAIPVAILSTDTPDEVAYKVGQAIAGSGATVNATVASVNTTTSTVTLESTANGAVTAPSLNGTATLVGSLSAGSYEYCIVYRWTDRNGNIYRSTPSVPQVVTAAVNDRASILVWAPALTNHAYGDVKIEVYRTQKNTQTLQLLSATAALSSGPSRVSISDKAADSTIAASEILYTDGGVLENFGVGACTAVSTFKNRLMVTMADDNTAVYYSRTNLPDDPVNLSVFNALRLDTDGLPVTAHAQMDDKLCIFKRHAPFVTAGDGSNDLGQGQSFQIPMRIPGDTGTANPNSLILSKAGLIFQTPEKGIYVLTRGLTAEYIGAPVDDYKSSVVSGAVLCLNYDHIVFSLQDQTTSLVFNQLLNRWDFWTQQQGDSACLWQGKYVRVKNNGKAFIEGSNYYDFDGTAQPYNPYVETAWLKLKGLESFQRVRTLMLLGQYVSSHSLTFNVLYDYITTASTAYSFDASTISAAPPYQVELMFGRQKCEAVKIKITTTPTGTPGGMHVLNVLEFEVGLKGGLNRLPVGKTT